MTDMIQKEQYKLVSAAAENIYHNPTILYPYEDVIKGVRVGSKLMKAVDQSTFQAFGRFTPNMFRVQDCFIEYFIRIKDRIISRLDSVNGRNDIDMIEKDVFKDLMMLLQTKTDTTRLDSYNRVRKPINLYIQHITALAREISNREELIRNLYIPLDRVLFGNTNVFTTQEIIQFKLDAKQGFGQIRNIEHYYRIQDFINEKALRVSSEIGLRFYPIYFDLFWNDRYLRNSCNLFYSNLKANGNPHSNNNEAIPKQNMSSRPSTSSQIYINIRNRVCNGTNVITEELEIDNSRWYGLNQYSKQAQKLIIELANMLEARGISLSPKYRNDKAVVFTLKNNESKNILTIWPQRSRIKVRILNVIDAYCENSDDFIKYDLVRLSRKKYDDIL